MIMGTENKGNFTVVQAEVPLASMFGYATVVRGLSKGMATFTMEMCRYARCRQTGRGNHRPPS
jgi:elongation factor G